MIGFITFEGGDGTGKSTQIQLLDAYLTERGKNCVTTREPGGTWLGELLRPVLLQAGRRNMNFPTELFLYLADRAQHVHEVISPAIAEGKIVLCDRYTDSTLAYQGYGRGIDLQLLVRFNEIATGGLKPDITFLFDCPVEIGLSRAAERKARAPEHRGKDRFESEKLEFHDQVRRGFLDLARAEPERFCVIGASGSAHEAFAAVKNIVDHRLGIK